MILISLKYPKSVNYLKYKIYPLVSYLFEKILETQNMFKKLVPRCVLCRSVQDTREIINDNEMSRRIDVSYFLERLFVKQCPSMNEFRDVRIYRWGCLRGRILSTSMSPVTNRDFSCHYTTVSPTDGCTSSASSFSHFSLPSSSYVLTDRDDGD